MPHYYWAKSLLANTLRILWEDLISSSWDTLGFKILLECVSSGYLWWEFASMLTFGFICGENCGCFRRPREEKKQNKKQPKSHASGLSYATAREDRCGYLHNGWHHKMRKAKAIKRGMKTQDRERSPQRSMFGSFTERCIFTTNLTRWSLEEVKDAYVLTLHYIFG